MREEGIQIFLEAFGVDRADMTVDRGWVNCPCPLAPFTHAGGADSRPSFGIKIDDHSQSVYWCFGCSSKALRLGWLLHTYFVSTGSYPYDASRIYLREELLQVPTEETIQVKKTWVTVSPKQVSPLPPKVLKKYPLLQGHSDYEAAAIRRWLEFTRGVPWHIQSLYRLRYNYDNQTVIFPLTDASGRIFLLRERMRKEKRIWTVNPELAGCPELTFPRIKEVGVWFGMELIDWKVAVMVVEGEIDAMRLAALGFLNSIASATSSVSDTQIDAVYAPVIILGYDADKAGNFAKRRIVDRIERRGKKTKLFNADWSLATKTDGTPCKDAGDIPDKEQLSIVLNNLEPV